MAHSPKDALLAAKEDLLAAYTSVHNSLGRLINLVHNSEPRVIADVLGSEFDRPSQSPPQDHHHHRRLTTTNGLIHPTHGPRPLPHPEAPKFPTSNPLYPAPSLPQTDLRHPPPPPGPSFMTVTPGAPRQAAHPHNIQSSKPRQRKIPQQHQVSHSYTSQQVQPLETDDDDDDDDDPEEPLSDEENLNGSGPHYYNNPPRQSTTVPTPPGSVPGGKKKRVKRERDPNAPKRPASAYILFQNAVRQEMRAANPTADYKELARQIGDRWKNLSEEAKRPWSEAGKLAMTSWNIQNKEYKTSHPDSTSPHTQANHFTAGQAPVPRKRRSRITEVDEHGNPLRKKRGRPSKAEKDNSTDHLVQPGQFVGSYVQQSTAPQIQSIHGQGIPQAQQSSVNEILCQTSNGALPETQAEGYSEEEEEGDEEEEEEEEDEDGEEYSHPPASSYIPPVQPNGTYQVSPQHPATTDSEPEEGEEYEGSEASPTESNHHMDTKMRIQPNGIMA